MGGLIAIADGFCLSASATGNRETVPKRERTTLMTRSVRRSVGALAILAVVAVGCGDDDAESEATDSTQQAGDETPTGATADPALSTIVIGAPTCLTGAVSSTYQLAEAVNTAWVQWVNETQGGINGHPVDLITGDTGCDGAQALDVVQTMVQQDGAVALFYADPLTVPAVQEFIESNRVPTIGGAVATDSPLYFMAGATIPHFQFGYPVLADLVGATELGAVVCAELPACAEGPRAYADVAAGLGINFVGTFAVAASAPSFTAECLAMKEDGVEALAVAVANATAQRLMEDCAAQDFHPYYIMSGLAVDETFAELGDVKLLSHVYTLPWFVEDGPMTAFHEAMTAYAPDATLGAVSSLQWASLELFRAAMADADEEVTNEDALAGLYGLEEEDLGGMLSKPLTFVDGEPSPVNACVFPAELVEGEFTLMQGLEPLCHDG